MVRLIMNLQETIRKVLREEHEDMHRKFNMFMRRRDSQIKDSIKGSMKIILAAVNANGIDKSKDFVIDAICNSAVILLFNENNLDLGGEEYYEWAKIYLKKYYSDYIKEKLGEDTKKGINESLSPWFRRRFDIDELDDLVKDVKDQIEEGQTMIDAIYDTVRQFIATKQFNDIDNAGTEQEYWDSYLVYEKPIIKFVKEKLKSDKEEMTEAELTEKCWAGYTQKGMKTMFGKRYPNCVKKTK